VQMNTLSSFQETLVDMAGFGVTDDRDRVYGMLGISREEDRKEWKPDYNASVRKVYIDTARRLLGRKDSILILHRAGLGSSQRLELPSWVPDWSSLETTTTLAFGRCWAKYNASGPHTPQISTGDDDTLVMESHLSRYLKHVPVTLCPHLALPSYLGDDVILPIDPAQYPCFHFHP
jgi:hypothetical protein